MQPELALLVREFVRRSPDAYKDFRIPDPTPKARPPGATGLLAWLRPRARGLLPAH